MARYCPFCKSQMSHEGGFDRSGADYGGAYLDVDFFRCACGREFKHVVKDNIGSGFDAWYLKNGEAWDMLPESLRPLTA